MELKRRVVERDSAQAADPPLPYGKPSNTAAPVCVPFASVCSAMERATSAMSVDDDADSSRPLDREVSKELIALDDSDDAMDVSDDEKTRRKKRPKREITQSISRSSTVEMTDADNTKRTELKSSTKKRNSTVEMKDADSDDELVLLSSTKPAVKGPPGSNGANYLFYAGKLKSKPMGNFIHEIHRLWFFNYDLLESHHGYIQWLFPVFESSGVNWDAESLTKAEAKLIREDFELATKFIRSYRLMLTFYGMVLVDEKTGKVKRHPQIWKSRYWNLLSYQHNFLRINRILACLGHMGFHRWRKGFLAHLEKEIYKTEELKICKSSFERFWKKNLEVNTQEFVRKTLELPEDRTESVYFHHMEKNTQEFQEYLARLKGEQEALMPLENEANQKDMADYERRLQRAREARERQLEANKKQKAVKGGSPSGIKKFLSKSSPNASQKPTSSSSLTSPQSSSSSKPQSPKQSPQQSAKQGTTQWLRYDSSDGGDSDVDEIEDSDEKVTSTKKQKKTNSADSDDE